MVDTYWLQNCMYIVADIDITRIVTTGMFYIVAGQNGGNLHLKHSRQFMYIDTC